MPRNTRKTLVGKIVENIDIAEREEACQDLLHQLRHEWRHRPIGQAKLDATRRPELARRLRQVNYGAKTVKLRMAAVTDHGLPPVDNSANSLLIQ